MDYANPHLLECECFSLSILKNSLYMVRFSFGRPRTDLYGQDHFWEISTSKHLPLWGVSTSFRSVEDFVVWLADSCFTSWTLQTLLTWIQVELAHWSFLNRPFCFLQLVEHVISGCYFMACYFRDRGFQSWTIFIQLENFNSQ